MNKIEIGQIWLSSMEPELGLGRVKHFDKKRISLHFTATGCIREYSVVSAPIKRVMFKVGDSIKSEDGKTFVVTRLSDEKGFVTYWAEDVEIPENKISPILTSEGPKYRLLTGFTDSNESFNIRYQTHKHKYDYQINPYRGFLGGRITLIPHQLYVATEITNRNSIRALLSDEAGLGKTIEASLILHRLLLSGIVKRILIIVPQPLIYQWFVELLRKFNLVFQTPDESFFETDKSDNAKENPFFENQLYISSFELLLSNSERTLNVLEADWDMVVVDEAHHVLDHTAEYLFLKQLSLKAKNMLLLTATPDQLGHKNHFSRLHLLDPDRYYDYQEFKSEEKLYTKIADFVNSLHSDKDFNKSKLRKIIEKLPSHCDNFKKELIKKVDNNTAKNKEHIINETIDLFGTGKNVFRNTRKVIKGFPKRFAHIVSLDGSAEEKENLMLEFAQDCGLNKEKNSLNYIEDSRVKWLKTFLLKNKDSKFLLICSSLLKVEKIEESLPPGLKEKTTLFHENLSLLRRDQNAAWFAEEDGAQLMLCSEIGSEGRNFQFSHNLILFDIPRNPELLEQRIGRLDRIGQIHDIHIHIPYVKGTAQEMLACWYHEGLNIFCENVNSSHMIYSKLGDALLDIVKNERHEQLDSFIMETKKLHDLFCDQIEKGRDRLLELNSFRPEKVKKMVSQIGKMDEQHKLKDFIFEVCEQFGIEVEYLTDKIFKFDFSYMTSSEFPVPLGKGNEVAATFDRSAALSNEHIEFLTWDHPMISGVVDLILGREEGTSVYGFWQDENVNELLVEAVFIMESVAPCELYIDRFFPQTPIRIVVNQGLKDLTNDYPFEKVKNCLKDISHLSILDNDSVKNKLVPKMIQECHDIAEDCLTNAIDKAVIKINKELGKDINRLEKLKKFNSLLPDKEIHHIKDELGSLLNAVKSSRLRVDGLRLVLRGKEEF